MKLDIIPIVMIGIVVVSGVYFLTEWQKEQVLTEDEAIDIMIANLKNLPSDQTNCTELFNALDKNESDIMRQAIHDKIKEMEC